MTSTPYGSRSAHGGSETGGKGPIIRTMQDDLSEARKTGSDVVSKHTASSPTPKSSIPLPPKKPSRGDVTLPPTPQKRKKGGLKIVLLFVGIGLLIGSGFGIVYTLFGQVEVTGTIADHIPANTEAAVVAKRSVNALSSHVLNAGTDALGVEREIFGESWEEVAYLLIPGGTASDSVPVVLIRGEKPVEHEEVSILQLNEEQRIWGVIRTQHRGRFEQTRQQYLGNSRFLIQASSEIRAADGMIYLGVQGMRHVASLTSDIGVSVATNPTLFLLQEGGGGVVEAKTIAGFSGWELFAEEGSTVPPHIPINLVPSDVTALSLRNDIYAAVRSWQQGLGDNPQAEQFLRELAEVPDVIQTIEGAIAGHGLLGVRFPSADSDYPESFAIIPLNEGMEETVNEALRELEPATLALTPLFLGRTVPVDEYQGHERFGVSIRYVNFTSPNRTIDYAIVDDVLLFSTSQKSMFDLVDLAVRAEERPEALVRTNFYEQLLALNEGVPWRFLQLHAHDGVSHLPSAWQNFIGIFPVAALFPGSDNTISALFVVQ